MKTKSILLTTLALLLLTVLKAQVPNYVPTNNLVGWFPFNGNANDESGNGNNGNINNAILNIDRYGNPNCAYEFNGINSYINIGSYITFNNAYTFSAWVKTNNAFSQARNVIISKLQSTGVYQYKSAELNIDNDQNFLVIQGNNLSYTYSKDVSYSVPSNTWIHIVITYDGQLIKHYINGAYTFTTAFTSLIDSIGSPIYFGARPWGTNGPTWYYQGIIDDIGIWKRALTNQEIQNLYSGINAIKNNKINDLVSLEIYPNPSQSLITIKASNQLIGEEYTVINQIGAAIFSGVLRNEIEIIDLTDKNNGIYYLTIPNKGIAQKLFLSK